MEIKKDTNNLPNLEDVIIDCEGVASTLMIMEDLMLSGCPQYENYLSAIILLRKKAEEITHVLMDAQDVLEKINSDTALKNNEVEVS